MMSSMYWFLPLTLFIFVDGQLADCNDDDSTLLRIVIQPCDNFPDGDKIEWKVRDEGEGIIKKGEFKAGTTFEDELCLVPTGCYVVDLEAYYGNAFLDGGSYSVFYDGTHIFTGGRFSGIDRSISFGNGCESPTPSQSVMPSATHSMSPTATPSPTITPSMSRTHTPSVSPTAIEGVTAGEIKAVTPSMSPTHIQLLTATDSMLPTATHSMSPSATPKVTEAPNASSVGSSDYTAVTTTIVIASLAVLCVGGW